MPSSPIKSILNFRDVGETVNGLPHQFSPFLRSSLLYRSARPDEASPSDRDALITTYGIKTIIDLRSATEHIEQAKKHEKVVCEPTPTASGHSATQEASRIPGVEYMDINLNGGAFSRALLWRLRWASLIKLLGLMVAGYRIEALSILGREVMAPRGLLGLGKDTLDFCHEEVRNVFCLLAEQTTYPVLIHCTQGKDRTGLIVILVLLLLQVPTESIVADYTASERELEPEKEARLKELGSIGLREEFFECPVGFVEDIKRYVDEEYSGVEGYLERCGVGQQMRNRVISNLSIDSMRTQR